ELGQPLDDAHDGSLDQQCDVHARSKKYGLIIAAGPLPPARGRRRAGAFRVRWLQLAALLLHFVAKPSRRRGRPGKVRLTLFSPC
ncbi:MAG: hypothetical protein Q8R98_20385, partial [Rubrivivax sp.]|nr:hypothetical protein [Rubrivivax sp.]